MKGSLIQQHNTINNYKRSVEMSYNRGWYGITGDPEQMQGYLAGLEMGLRIIEETDGDNMPIAYSSVSAVKDVTEHDLQGLLEELPVATPPSRRLDGRIHGLQAVMDMLMGTIGYNNN